MNEKKKEWKNERKKERRKKASCIELMYSLFVLMNETTS